MRHAAKFHHTIEPIDSTDVCGALAIAFALVFAIGFFVMMAAGSGPKLAPGAGFGTAELGDL